MNYTKEGLRQQIDAIIKSHVLKAQDGEILGAAGNIMEIPIIKAVPEMYEALKELCSVLSHSCAMSYLSKHNLSLPLSKGQQILAKAEGKE